MREVVNTTYDSGLFETYSASLRPCACTHASMHPYTRSGPASTRECSVPCPEVHACASIHAIRASLDDNARYWYLQNLIGLFGGDEDLAPHVDVGFSLEPALDSSSIVGDNTPINPAYNPRLPSCFFPSTEVQGDIIADARKFKEAANQCHASSGGSQGSYGPVKLDDDILHQDVHSADILHAYGRFHAERALGVRRVRDICILS